MLSLKDFEFKAIVFIIAGEDHLKFANENLVIIDPETEKIKHQVPLIKIFSIFIIGSITITSVLLEKAAKYGCSLIFLKFNFKPISYMGVAAEGNTLLRLKQYQCARNAEYSVKIVQNKINNQLANLNHIRQKSDEVKHAISRLKDIIESLETAGNMDNNVLLGMEGNASKIYFKAYFEDIGWNSRKPRVKNDELNTLLDIGYTFLFNFIEANLKIYGFDVYYGFYHRLFYQRKSLVSDLMEPFRCLVDKSIRESFNLKKFSKDDFIERNLQYILRIDKNKKYTKELFKDILERKSDIFLYIREYYRFTMKEKPMEEFPVFQMEKNADC